MARLTFDTNRPLWALFAIGIFVGLGFVDLVAGVAKGDNSLWSYVGLLVTGKYYCSTEEILIAVLLSAAIRAVPAVLVAWVAQALIVILVKSVWRRRQNNAGMR